jgi:hypothetical protein
MTKIAIVPNAAGTGTFTIEAPNSNSNRTLTLPDAAGELLTDVSDIETQVKAATNATGSAPVFAARAWVNFDGTTTTPTIRASGNVSSVTKVATGSYTTNFTTAMPDANYAVTATSSTSGVVTTVRININPSASSFGVLCNETELKTATDASIMHVAVFR